jgi:multiple sugar transport system ATP-binding protein
VARVELENLSKIYDGKGEPAVRDLSLDINDGEFLVLVGPSGCGKSSVLRMVAGLEEITEGEIRIDGKRVNEVAPKDRDVAMVFQNYALYPHMSVFDNMAFGLKLRKMAKSEIESRVTETARFLGLGDYLKRRPRELSGGERQRVALGRALVRRPRLFLFDEPLSNLDAKLRVGMRAEISRLHNQIGATMIYVTHDQVEAMTLGERIALLERGVLQQCADPLTLYDRPTNRFVAGFIGSPAMNFFDVDLSADRADIRSGEEVLHLPGAHQQALGKWDGSGLTMGVRPEHLGFEPRPGGALSGQVAVREQLGNEVLLYIDGHYGSLVMRLDPGSLPEVGEAVKVFPDLDRAHFFDPSTEAVIS